MSFISVILVSEFIGALMGATIFFVKEEPYKFEIFLATIIRNVLVGLLTVFSIQQNNSVQGALGFGALYGFLSTLVVFLSKGIPSMKVHIPILIFGTITGAITGAAIYYFLL